LSRIYVIKGRKSGELVRYVRAHTLNGAVRALAEEKFAASTASTEELFQAMKTDTFDVLDALAPTQVDLDDKDDPGPVPLRMAK
jgi:hypothetical protein